jgi:hypothetical protein
MASFFVTLLSRNGGDFLTIEEYIKSKERFHLMPFVTVYTTIVELIKDGLVDQNIFSGGDTINVGVRKFEPPKKECRGLYCASDWHSNR